MLRSIVRFLACLPVAAAAWADPAPPYPALVAGIEAYNRGDYETARRSLQSAADGGEAEAMANLASLYERGQGVARDVARTRELLTKAAGLGDSEAMNAIGDHFSFRAPPDRRNYPEAARWFCSAVALGNPRAMNNLGILLEQGLGVDQDLAEARDLWQQSADLGDLNAAAHLAQSLLADPQQPEAARRQAQQSLVAAGLRGNAYAQLLLKKQGYTGPLPPGFNTQRLMYLEPREQHPGKAKLCNLMS